MKNGSNRSICGSCKHQTNCLYCESNIARHFCEEFEVDVLLSSNIVAGQRNQNESTPDYGDLVGLCMNCNNNPLCVHTKADLTKTYCLEHA